MAVMMNLVSISLYITQCGVQKVEHYIVTYTHVITILFASELQSFLKTLDERLELDKTKAKKHTTERMQRIEGSLLHSSPPTGAPLWTVDKEWLKGIFI